MTYPKFLASSVDPTQLSLTVESFSKVVIGLLAWWGVSKGFNVLTAQNQLQVIIDIIAQSVPIAFTLWNAMLTVWGLVRKLLSLTLQPAIDYPPTPTV